MEPEATPCTAIVGDGTAKDEPDVISYSSAKAISCSYRERERGDGKGRARCHQLQRWDRGITSSAGLASCELGKTRPLAQSWRRRWSQRANVISYTARTRACGKGELWGTSGEPDVISYADGGSAAKHKPDVISISAGIRAARSQSRTSQARGRTSPTSSATARRRRAVARTESRGRRLYRYSTREGRRS